jgi:hypothetical protein
MIRQAHTYMVGAVSGATLIVVAIAVFVLLVSAQVFRDWPIAALGDSGGGSVGVADARSTSAAPGATRHAAAETAKPATATVAANNNAGGGKAAGEDAKAGTIDSTTAASTVHAGAGPEEAGGGGGSPTASAPTTEPPAAKQAAGSGASGSGGGSGSGSGSTATTASGKVTETVNNTVGAVDETVTEGALESTGVTGVTEEVVNGVVGPESPVGKVVDETVGVVEGLLHPKH